MSSATNLVRCSPSPYQYSPDQRPVTDVAPLSSLDLAFRLLALEHRLALFEDRGDAFLVVLGVVHQALGRGRHFHDRVVGRLRAVAEGLFREAQRMRRLVGD